jgi:hypothetical protein
LNIGLISVFVRRANTRFAPTLVLLIGLITVFVRDEHKVRPPTRRITKYLLRSTQKFMIAYLSNFLLKVRHKIIDVPIPSTIPSRRPYSLHY